MAMEGAGPAGGAPRSVGLVLAGRDAVAVDAVAQDLVGFRREDVETTACAGRRGLGRADLGAIEIAGETIEAARVKRFRKAAFPVGLLKRRLPASLYAYISGELILSPEVVPAACTGCEECVRACPRRAVVMERGLARIMGEPCIRCLCCHEVCRAGAIRLRQRPVGRAARLLGSLFRL